MFGRIPAHDVVRGAISPGLLGDTSVGEEGTLAMGGDYHGWRCTDHWQYAGEILTEVREDQGPD